MVLTAIFDLAGFSFRYGCQGHSWRRNCIRHIVQCIYMDIRNSCTFPHLRAFACQGAVASGDMAAECPGLFGFFCSHKKGLLPGCTYLPEPDHSSIDRDSHWLCDW